MKEEILGRLERKNGKELVTKYVTKLKQQNLDYVEFLEILATRESSGDYSAHNKGSEFLGRYQIGSSTFEQIGFKDSNGRWTDLAKSLGVTSEETYLKSEIAQEVAVLFALRWDYQYLISNGDQKYIGTTVDGVVLTESGLIAGMHLVGNGDMHKVLNGDRSWEKTKDGNETPALKYVEEMGNLDMSGVLGGIQ